MDPQELTIRVGMRAATRFNPYLIFLSVAIAVSVIASRIAHSPQPYPLAAAASLLCYVMTVARRRPLEGVCSYRVRLP